MKRRQAKKAGWAVRKREGKGRTGAAISRYGGAHSSQVARRLTMLGGGESFAGKGTDIAARDHPEWFYEIEGVKLRNGSMVGLPLGVLAAARWRCKHASLNVCEVSGRAYIKTETSLGGAFQLQYRLGIGERVFLNERRFQVWKGCSGESLGGSQRERWERTRKAIERQPSMTTETDLKDLANSMRLFREEIHGVLGIDRGKYFKVVRGDWKGWMIYRVK